MMRYEPVFKVPNMIVVPAEVIFTVYVNRNRVS